MANKVEIKIGADSSGFKKGVDAVKAGFAEINKSSLSFSKIAGGAFSSFLGNLSANAVSSAFSSIKNGFSSAISSAREFTQLAGVQEDAVNALNVSLAQTGKFTAQRSKDFQQFASELQATSKFGDEVILKNAAIIQSFGKLDSDGLKRATQAAADFAAGSGKSFDEVTKIIARASAGQVEPLKELGIQIENTGDRQRDFEKALSQIEKRFSGSALAALNTYTGAQAQAANIVGDFKEEVGGLVTQNPIFIAALKGVGDAFKFLIGEVQNNKEALQDFVSGGVGIFVKGIGFAADSINFFLDLSSGFKAFFAEVTDLSLATGQSFVEFAKTIVDSSVSVTDFFGKTTEAQLSAQRSLETSVQVFEQARLANEEKVLSDISANESLKESISSVSERIQQEINNRIEAEREGGEISKNLQLQQLNDAAVARQEASEQEKEFRKLFNEEFLQEQRDLLGAAAAEQTKLNLEKLANEGKFNQALLTLNQQRENAQRASFFNVLAFEKQTQRERIQNLQSTFGQIASLQASGSAELFAIGKAAAIATATIDGIAAVQKALSAAPPPFNFALAAVVGAAQTVNLGKIASAKPPTGAFNGAMVEGGSIFSDTEPFMLSKGEIVAPRKDFDDVVEGTARQRGFVKADEAQAQSVAPTININGPVIGTQEFVNDLIEQIRDAVQFRNADLGVR